MDSLLGVRRPKISPVIIRRASQVKPASDRCSLMTKLPADRGLDLSTHHVRRQKASTSLVYYILFSKRLIGPPLKDSSLGYLSI